MTSPTVSVVIPNYNHAKYLRQRIDSVLQQSFHDFEVIILDDASRDNSKEIIDEYASDPRISKILINSINTGSPFKQWERGLSLSRGKWVWIAESDDFADISFLEKMLSAVEGKDNVGLIYCDARVVLGDEITDETFAEIKNKSLNTSRWGSGYSNNGADEIENYLLGSGTINNCSSVMFRRDIMNVAAPFDINLRYIGDKYAYMKMLSKSDVLYVAEALNFYRDPFTSKHTDKYINYFYEQFIVFDWAYRNLRIADRKKFFKGFYSNTHNSLYRGWNRAKVNMYVSLFRKNPTLLVRSVINNLSLSIRSLITGKSNDANLS